MKGALSTDGNAGGGRPQVQAVEGAGKLEEGALTGIPLGRGIGHDDAGDGAAVAIGVTVGG
jgi:hypothetical protein